MSRGAIKVSDCADVETITKRDFVAGSERKAAEADGGGHEATDDVRSVGAENALSQTADGSRQQEGGREKGRQVQHNMGDVHQRTSNRDAAIYEAPHVWAKTCQHADSMRSEVKERIDKESE